MTSPNQKAPPTDNKQIVHRFTEDCWNKGKLDAVSQYVAKDCRLHDPVFPTLTKGADTLRTHIESCRRAFPDIHFTIEDTIAERDEVVIQWTSTGTHEGVFLGMPATHRKVHVSGTSIDRLENGKIVEQWSHWNVMTLMEQLGVSAISKTPQPQP